MKNKIELSDLGKSHTKEYLKNYLPFLNNEFRLVLKSELESEEALK